MPSERAILEAASVVGVTFAPQLVAQALGGDGEDVEDVCRHRLQSHLLLKVGGRLSNVNVSRPFEFTHALHRQVIYDQIDEIRRQRLHRENRRSAGMSPRGTRGGICCQLSVHFERSGDHERSLSYLGACAEQAQRRFAHARRSPTWSTLSVCSKGCPTPLSTASRNSSFVFRWACLST